MTILLCHIVPDYWTFNENEEVNVKGDDDGDAPLGSIGFQSSFSNSSNSVLIKEANESERLEENKEKEPLQEVYNFKGFELSTASEVEKESHINSNIESNNTPPVSPCSEKEAECSAARPQQQKEPGMDMSDYLEECIAKKSISLARLRKNDLPQDDNLFWRTVGLCCDLYGQSKNDAVRYLNKLISEQIRKGIV